MKKHSIASALVLSVILTGCGKKAEEPAAQTAAETAAPQPEGGGATMVETPFWDQLLNREDDSPAEPAEETLPHKEE
ncbi:MAG: hypothetical protein K6G61_05725, partial [Solobacterium sp.]|nr:hypothetical protein [Solobacterium sp.]